MLCYDTQRNARVPKVRLPEGRCRSRGRDSPVESANLARKPGISTKPKNNEQLTPIMDRREFLKRSVLLTAGAVVGSRLLAEGTFSKTPHKIVGLQLYSLRDAMKRTCRAR